MGSEILINLFRLNGVDISKVHSACGLYGPLVEFAGATVPLTGFGYQLAKGVYLAVMESGLLGAFTGGLQACAGGITAAVIFGLVAALLFKRGDKTAKAL